MIRREKLFDYFQNNVYTKYIHYMEVNFMQTQVKAWGNSQGIRLPKDILQEANVEINDMLEVKVSDGMIMLVKTFRHQKLEERAEKFGGKLNLDGEYEWDKPEGREVW